MHKHKSHDRKIFPFKMSLSILFHRHKKQYLVVIEDGKITKYPSRGVTNVSYNDKVLQREYLDNKVTRSEIGGIETEYSTKVYFDFGRKLASIPKGYRLLQITSSESKEFGRVWVKSEDGKEQRIGQTLENNEFQFLTPKDHFVEEIFDNYYAGFFNYFVYRANDKLYAGCSPYDREQPMIIYELHAPELISFTSEEPMIRAVYSDFNFKTFKSYIDKDSIPTPEGYVVAHFGVSKKRNGYYLSPTGTPKKLLEHVRQTTEHYFVMMNGDVYEHFSEKVEFKLPKGKVAETGRNTKVFLVNPTQKSGVKVDEAKLIPCGERWKFRTMACNLPSSR